MEVEGYCKSGFEFVRDTFGANFDLGLEVGASVAVTKDGEPVVDLWAGEARPGVPWVEDTIVNVYSTTKTMAAICVLMLADRGEVDLAAPVATYWPEFAQNGKEGITVAHVMSHSSGLPGFDPPLADPTELYDWDARCDQLARQAPWWEPGTVSGYHLITQGYLQGEIVRRVTGKSLGNFFREEVAEPLGADFHIGLAVEHDARLAELIPPEVDPAKMPDRDSVAGRALRATKLTGLEPLTRSWCAAEIPSAGGIGNARSVARIHAALACGGTLDGVRLLSEAALERILEEQTNGQDLVLGMPVRYGMGFGLNDPRMPISPNERAFFWGGWGGSLAVIDLDARVSIAYVMNRMAADLLGDMRGASLVAATYAAFAG